MAVWAATSRTRIAATQGYALYSSAMIPIDQGMKLLAEQPAPYDQQNVAYVEGLLAEWDTVQAQITTAGLDDGIVQLDVIKFSDRAGVKTENPLRLRDEISKRIAQALGLPQSSGSSCHGRRVRS